MRYVRERRLSEATRVLAGGATDILAVAVDHGYGSHEGFTRAFRELFGTTRAAVRERRDVAALALVEPIKMEETVRASLPPVRFEHGKVLLIAGIAQRYTCETSAAIPSQWHDS
jgi:AraC family transcriptional regulator